MLVIPIFSLAKNNESSRNKVKRLTINKDKSTTILKKTIVMLDLVLIKLVKKFFDFW